MNWTSFSTLAGNGTWQPFKDVFYLLSLVVALLLYRDHLSSRSFDRTNLLLDYFEGQVANKIAYFNHEFDQVLSDGDYQLLLSYYYDHLYQGGLDSLNDHHNEVTVFNLGQQLEAFSKETAVMMIKDLANVDTMVDKRVTDDMLSQIATKYSQQLVNKVVSERFEQLDFDYDGLLTKLNRLGLYMTMSKRMIKWSLVSDQMAVILNGFWSIPKYQVIFEQLDNVIDLKGVKFLKHKFT
jgi:hypothetical protein